MKGAPLTEYEKLDAIDTIVRAVDQRGRDMDRKWGTGRLPVLVPTEWAERFKRAKFKFSTAVWERDPADTDRHGQAMLRAYDKLDELAVAAGASSAPPDQWEMDTPNGLIIVVRDLADVERADTGGRKAQVWSLEEVANVIAAHPLIVAAKREFPGAVVESVRPARQLRQELNDDLEALPF